MKDKPYTREELVLRPDTFPDRGPICPKCNTRIPQFADLSDHDAYRVRSLIRHDQKALAMDELMAASGCSERFAKIWVIHSGVPNVIGTTAPCPYCNGALKTALAKQCPHCYMNWHDPDNPYNMKNLA